MTMRHFMTAGACAAAMMLCACDESAPSGSEKDTAQSLSDQAKDAMDAASDYAAEKKDQLMESMQSQYDAIKPKIEELKTEANNAGENASAQVTKAMNELEVKRAAFEAQMKELKDATAKTWTSISESVHDAWQDLQAAYDDAAEELSADKSE